MPTAGFTWRTGDVLRECAQRRDVIIYGLKGPSGCQAEEQRLDRGPEEGCGGPRTAGQAAGGSAVLSVS